MICPLGGQIKIDRYVISNYLMDWKEKKIY